MKTHKVPTIVFWVICALLLGGVGCLWIIASSGPSSVPSARTNRAKCNLNVRNAQQAVRAWQAANSAEVGSALTLDQLMKVFNLAGVSHCPDGEPYACDNVIPAEGELFLRCPDPYHNEFDHHDW